MNRTQPVRILGPDEIPEFSTDTYEAGWVRPYPIAGFVTVPRPGELHLREDGVHGQVWHFGVHLSEGRYMIVVLPDEPDDGADDDPRIELTADERDTLDRTLDRMEAIGDNEGDGE
jgi:hypothetical protein